MTARDSNVANRYLSTLSSDMGSADLVANVVTTAGGPSSPCYLVIDPDDDAKAEYIYFDGTFSGTTFTTTNLANRYLSGSAAASGITHLAGAVVTQVVTKQHLDDLHDRIDLSVSDHGGLTGLADDDHTAYLTYTRHDGAHQMLSATASGSNQTLTSGFADVTGATVTFTTSRANAVAQVAAFLNLDASAAAGECQGQCVVDGVAQSGVAVLNTDDNDGEATVGQVWQATLVSAGSHTIKLQARDALGSGSALVVMANTKLNVHVVD